MGMMLYTDMTVSLLRVETEFHSCLECLTVSVSYVRMRGKSEGGEKGGDE